MKYPIIKVYEPITKTEHIVGENIHDVLYVDGNGALQYLNAQCFAGTEDNAYKFVPRSNENEWMAEIQFVSIDQLIDMASEHLEETTKKKIESYKRLREYWEQEMQKTREETGFKFDTGGLLP